MMDWDEYGHCCLCHRNMLIEQVIDGKIQKRFTPEYTEKSYKLDDGSLMRVALCLQCTSNITEEDNKKIMDCVVKGWDRETDKLVESPLFPEWTPDKKKQHMDVYSKRNIVEVA